MIKKAPIPETFIRYSIASTDNKYATGRDERIIGLPYNVQIQRPVVRMQFIGTDEEWRKFRRRGLDDLTKLIMHLPHSDPDARSVNYNQVSLNQNEQWYVCSLSNQMISENRNRELFRAKGHLI